MLHMEVCPYSFFQWCRFRRSMGVMSSQWGSQNFFKDWHLMNSQPTIFFFDLFLTQWIMAILSKRCKPDNFEPNKSLKLSLKNIREIRSSFVESESFLESNSPDILALCNTNLDDSFDSGNFSVRVYLSLIQKDSITHMHGLVVYLKF